MSVRKHRKNQSEVENATSRDSERNIMRDSESDRLQKINNPTGIWDTNK